MTPQEIFDKAYTGVMKQGLKSSGPRGCMYRGPNGLKCGVGHLVDDNLGATMDMEFSGMASTSIDEIISLALDDELEYEIPRWMIENRDLLQRIQTAHDSTVGNPGCFAVEFSDKMRKVAEDYSLTVPVSI
jgi:hypothetical protein